MKKIIFCFLAIVLINVSCDKKPISPNEIEIFKEKDIIQFQGEVLDEEISWKKSDNRNNGIGSRHGTYLCVVKNDTTIQQKWFSIYDSEKRGELSSLRVFSPAFKVTDFYENKKSIFELGKKSFYLKDNSVYDGFKIEGVKNGSFFSSSYGNQDESSFEVVKFEDLPWYGSHSEGYTKNIRLWIVVSCNLYQSDGQKIGRMENGKFISEI